MCFLLFQIFIRSVFRFFSFSRDINFPYRSVPFALVSSRLVAVFIYFMVFCSSRQSVCFPGELRVLGSFFGVWLYV